MMGKGNQSGSASPGCTAASPPTIRSWSSRSIATARASLNLPIREVTDALGGAARIELRQRLRPEQPRVSRLRAGRPGVPRQARTTCGSTTRAPSNGQMVPLDSVVRMRETTAPAVISHFNLFRSTELTGSPAPGVSSGQAIAYMEQLAHETLPARVRFRVGGAVARGNPRRIDRRVPLRPQHPARVSRARRAVRELGAAVHHPARRAARGVRRAQRAAAARVHERRVLPGRASSC